MKIITTLLLTLHLGLLAVWAQLRPLPTLVYQATLSSNGVPVNGPHDFVLSLHDSASGGTQLGPSQTNLAVDVSGGECRMWDTWEGGPFFTSPNLYLEVALRPYGSAAPFVTLLPRQRIAHLPLSAVAETAMSISLDALSPASLGTNAVDGNILGLGTVTGDKIAPTQVVKSLNGLQDGVNLVAGDGLTLTASSNTIRVAALPPVSSCFDYTNCYWSLHGNGNIVPGVNFMGTLNAVPVEFRVNNTHAMRYEWPGYTGGGPLTPNIIGGAQENAITAGRGSAILSGGYAAQPNHMENGHWDVIAGGVGNRITNQYCVIGGGLHNHIHGSANPFSGWYSAIVGGFLNTITLGTGATISGGKSNLIGADHATIGGGVFNTNLAISGTLSGGHLNRIEADADSATVGGGDQNQIQANAPYATIPGGLQARADNYGQQAYASGQFGGSGDAQTSLFVLRTNTTDNVPAELFLDGGVNNKRMIVPNGATWTFHILLVARSDAASVPPSLSAGWEIEGVIQNVNNFVTLCSQVKLICPPTLPGPWAMPSVQALNIPVQALAINVTGAANANVRWVASVRTVEVTNP